MGVVSACLGRRGSLGDAQTKVGLPISPHSVQAELGNNILIVFASIVSSKKVVQQRSVFSSRSVFEQGGPNRKGLKHVYLVGGRRVGAQMFRT